MHLHAQEKKARSEDLDPCEMLTPEGPARIQETSPPDGISQKSFKSKYFLLLLYLILAFSVLSLQLNKYQMPTTPLARSHKEVRRSRDHIMVTARYSNQRSKTRQNPCQVQPTENIEYLSDTNVSSPRKVTQRQVMRHFTSDSTDNSTSVKCAS